MSGKPTDDNISTGAFFPQCFKIIQICVYNLDCGKSGFYQFSAFLAPDERAITVVRILEGQH